MRTTLTLDDDVTARLKQLKGFSSFEEAVSETIRAGLSQLEPPSNVSQQPYRTRSLDVGGFKIKNVDNIAEILDLIE